MTHAAHHHHHHHSTPMRCMEIRGGSRAVEETLEMPGLDAWVYSRPYEGDERGGDVYYVSLCGGGLVTRVVVADVSGHGKVVAGFSEFLRNIMRKHINSKNPTKLARMLNREFSAMAHSERFATAVVATYLANRQTLTICNAGHPRPLWFQAARQTWTYLDENAAASGNLPLGLDDDSAYHQFSVKLDPGDIVLFYTDAITEASSTDAPNCLGEEGLLQIVGTLDTSLPARLGPNLITAIENHRGGQPADDDLTLVVLQHNGKGPKRLTITDKLDVYAKVFRLKSV